MITPATLEPISCRSVLAVEPVAGPLSVEARYECLCQLVLGVLPR